MTEQGGAIFDSLEHFVRLLDFDVVLLRQAPSAVQHSTRLAREQWRVRGRAWLQTLPGAVFDLGVD
jgi:hypothetical protein